MRDSRQLAKFSPGAYDRGRGRLWQILWFATMNLIFMKWWFPARLRPMLLRSFGASVGPGVLIRHRVRVLWPWKLTIGRDSWIGEGVWILNLEPVTIGDNVCLSQEAFLCTGSHDARDPTFGYDNAPIAVGDGAWVCARAVVLRGTEVAPGRTVAAGTVFSRGTSGGDL